MTTRYREPLPRLNIPPWLNLQQPVAFDAHQPMFSPALPSHKFNSGPPCPISDNSLQTPMQPFLNPAAPIRSAHKMQPSIAHLSSTTVNLPFGVPLRKAHFPHASISLVGVPSINQQIHPPRNRRQPSIGGPPKAPLGGPGRKISPLPLPSATPLTTIQKPTKKLNVVLPKETLPGEDGKLASHPSWARTPLKPSPVINWQVVTYPELSSAESFPSDSWRYHEPTTIDVFLPGKNSWDAIRRQAIEEKLEKLGVERGTVSTISHLHGPHVRASSISSPADPALLYFKLNRLQQTQNVSSLSSLSSSPRALLALSPAPHPSRLHGKSMSFAQPPSSQHSITGSLGLNHSGRSDTLGTDQSVTYSSASRPPVIVGSQPLENILAPQGRVPLTVPSFDTPLLALRSDSRPDFARGFGLDIPEEEEPQELAIPNGRAEGVETSHVAQEANANELGHAQEIEVSGSQDEDGLRTASQSMYHSRHVSRLSAAISPLVDGHTEACNEGDMVPLRNAIPVPEIDDLDQDAAGEWTGSEDLYLGGSSETSEDESIGEWSNPSDEERARNRRVERRMRRSAPETELPRRLPNFPRPPGNTMAQSLRRDDDIISNPSEEDHDATKQPGGILHLLSSNVFEPCPRHSHSRGVSGQLSTHAPSQSHSRATSYQLDSLCKHQQLPSLSGRRNSLNPFAKPFIFGASRGSGSSAPRAVESTTVFGHSRLPSIGKPLNAAAQEFKPGGFTFRPPPGVPQLTFPDPETARPLPSPPAGLSPIRTQQGREKRQRRGSSTSQRGEDSMDSFRFPNPCDITRLSEPPSPTIDRRINAFAQPLQSSSFPGPFSSTQQPNSGMSDEDGNTARVENGNCTLPQKDVAPLSSVKEKRAPVPLDFNHPTSCNTIPAGVFKALVNAGDERTRRSVRSRLSSREIFEHTHRPSLDDLVVPPISQKKSRNPIVTELPREVNDVFGSNVKHRPSSPSAFHSPATSSESRVSVPSIDLIGKFKAYRFEQQLNNLNEKLDVLRRDYKDATRVQSMSPTTKTMVNEVVSLFRTQLQDSASRGLDESQVDARCELDLELVKDLVQQGHVESQGALKRELNRFAERLEEIRSPIGLFKDTKPFLEQLNARIIDAIATTISQLSDRFESADRSRQALAREGLVDELMSVLTPVLASLRTEPVDYEYLTCQLSQAVKPHISQLIDLASDKRETANLIVDQLRPLLQPALSPATPFDSGDLSGQLTSEIRRLIAPIDPFEIKEQVADLVVERLDSRLALRDRSFNADVISVKVNEGVVHLLQPIQHVTSALIKSQEDLSIRHDDLASLHKDTIHLLSDLSPKLVMAMEAINAQVESHSRMEGSVPLSEPDENIISIKLLRIHKDILDRLDTLLESFVPATNNSQVTIAGFASSHESAKHELDESRKSTAEYQTQLSTHEQLSVEKDLREELHVDTNDQDLLLGQLNEMRAAFSAKTDEALAARARNSELEEALSQALGRLQASDVAAQTSQECIASLDKLNRELVSENQMLRSKADALGSQVTVATSDAQAASQSLAALQKQYDNLSALQSQWVDLCHVSEQMKTLTTLIAQADNDEVNDLRRIRGRCNLLEDEHSALQKRFKDQEVKVVNSERAALVARQSLLQAQQRASEWESRAKDYEGKLDLSQTKLDQAEQTQAQLDTDYSLATLQLEEQEADHRLAKERESKLHEQIKILEAHVTRLQGELEHARTTPIVSRNRQVITSIGPTRIGSMMIDCNAGTPSLQTNGRPPSSVWDSMHAPVDHASSGGGYLNQVPSTPKARSFFRPSFPSPTPSNVSLAPTQGEDGWWE